MIKNEDKQYICSFLTILLHQTRGGEDILYLKYSKDGPEETVKIKYLGGGEKLVNVSMDSGTAMIRDIMAVID